MRYRDIRQVKRGRVKQRKFKKKLPELKSIYVELGTCTHSYLNGEAKPKSWISCEPCTGRHQTEVRWLFKT